MSVQDKASFSGTIEKITYRNESNAYTVLTLSNGSEEITAVGIMPFVSEGEFISCTGEYVIHATYGEQLKVESFERVIKEDSASILKYLSSGAIKGIGPATARKIVECFHEKSLEIIENNPERLVQIKGITVEKAYAISEYYKSQFGMREIMLTLAPFNITPAEALKIFRRFGPNSLSKIENNPYLLCFEGINFDFERVEQIADTYQFERQSEERVFAGVKYVLLKNTQNSHTCLPLEKLVPVAANMLEVNTELVEMVIENSVSSFNLISENINDKPFIFLPEYYNSEKFSAARIKVLSQYAEELFPLADIEIDRVENILGFPFANLQREAVKSAVENGVFILTGGPGTGKTTTLNAMIKIFEHRELEVVLAAPTGRAARRITELTGLPAKTLHRLLEADYGDDEKNVFCRNEKNPLECDVLIIDEMSMVDTFLFEGVLKALKVGARLILVGDSNQLPSVGAGNILSDLLQFSDIPRVTLNTVFRQASKSLIVTNAHKIVGGENPEFSNLVDSDCFFIRSASPQETVNIVAGLVNERLPNAYGFSPSEDIQVICPSRRFSAGTTNLNSVLQSAVNPKTNEKNEMNFKGGIIRTGDKVMQIKNNYDIIWDKADGETGSGIFNGDIGYVTEVDRRFMSLTVDFDGKKVVYSGEELSQLELAYAVTVHKSQGSEFECVIIPLSQVPDKLCYRNLLYTAVTRAKKLLVIVGNSSVISQMVFNDRKALRYTGFGHFLEG